MYLDGCEGTTAEASHESNNGIDGIFGSDRDHRNVVRQRVHPSFGTEGRGQVLRVQQEQLQRLQLLQLLPVRIVRVHRLQHDGLRLRQRQVRPASC